MGRTKQVTLKKSIANFLINVGIMFIVLSFFPGFKAPYQAVSNLYAGVLFALVLIISRTVRSIFRLPKVAIVNFIVGTVLTFGVMWLVNNFSTNVFSFGENVVGGQNFIFFTIPKVLVLQDVNLVIIFAAIIANFCSIIITKLKH
jgi:hypothetical protein